MKGMREIEDERKIEIDRELKKKRFEFRVKESERMRGGRRERKNDRNLRDKEVEMWSDLK